MDAKRFDTLARALTGARTRRSALGAVVAGGVLSALGFGREEAVRAAQGQGDLCVLAGPGGTCVLAFEAIVRQGPSARQPLVAGGTPGALRGYLRFSLSGNGSMEDADLLLDDGSSLPVAGLAIGHGFQARIDLGQGRALVAVGVGEQDITRCLGRLDGTVTGTEVGDLGEWHAAAGVQNIPSAAGGGTQTGGSSTPSDSGSSGTESQPISGSAPTDGSEGSTTDGGSGNTPASEPTANQPVSKLSEAGSQASEGTAEPGASAGSAPSSGGGNRPASTTSDNPPVSASTEDSTSTELRQESTGSGDELACPEGETRCGNICVNLQTDENNCGECGLPCASELSAGVCIGGTCACSPGTTRCDDVCANTKRDPLNCGQCGNACPDAQECLDGACAPEATVCPDGQTLCDDACVNLQTDINNCGACGIGCAGGEECAGGVCKTAAEIGCPEGQLLCGDMCRTGVPIPSGGIVCSGGGAPPTACPLGQALCNGACVTGDCQPAAECPPGQGLCYGLCRDFQNDPGYCGGCSSGCTGGAYCAAGTCVYCSSALTPCGNDCVDTRTDLDNCGACGNRCGTQCIDGQCTAVGPSPLATCQAELTRCGDFCVDLAVRRRQLWKMRCCLSSPNALHCLLQRASSGDLLHAERSLQCPGSLPLRNALRRHRQRSQELRSLLQCLQREHRVSAWSMHHRRHGADAGAR